MKKIVSFSGGRTSAYLVIESIEQFGPDNVDVVCMDTGAEHPGTYEFIRKFDEYIKEKYGVEITYLRTDFDTPLGKGNGYHVVGIDGIGPDLKPFSEMMAKYGTPYIGGMFCTDRMKLVPFTKYCQEKYGKGSYETWLGIRADEPNRLSKKKGIRYLAEISDFEKQDVIDFWKEMPFDLEIEEWNGNCVFCPKKSNLKLAAAQRDNPGEYIDFIEAISSKSVRMVDSRTISYMRDRGVKEYEPFTLFRRSKSFIQRLRKYNSELFTRKNKKWGYYEKRSSLAMYRGKMSLQDVIAMFDGSAGDEIKARIRGNKMTDAGSCSESCEVLVCQSNQIDMFK